MNHPTNALVCELEAALEIVNKCESDLLENVLFETERGLRQLRGNLLEIIEAERRRSAVLGK